MLQAAPSFGQSAASAALAGHIGLVLSHAGAELFAFKDRSPASEIHYLVIPKRFVRDAAQLGPADAELVRRMEAKAIELVRASVGEAFDPAELALGFHWPPWYSVRVRARVRVGVRVMVKG